MKKIRGIIYKYVSPSGKIYIGQTVNEKRRKKEFLNINHHYGGEKINNARIKYDPKKFAYEVLFENQYHDIESANIELNEKEAFFIEKYDTIKNGYNISTGGDSIRAVMKDETCKKRMISALKEYYKTHPNPFKGKTHSDETKNICRQKAMGRHSGFSGKKVSNEQKELQKAKLKEYYKTHENPFKRKKNIQRKH